MVILNPVKLTVTINHHGLFFLNQRDLWESRAQSQMQGPGDKGQQAGLLTELQLELLITTTESQFHWLHEAERVFTKEPPLLALFTPHPRTSGLEINSPLCWKEFSYLP